MVKIILAIFILGVIVALHEFGHFIVAKLCGIRVNQFAIGMGPAILKKQWGETEYSLRLLPIGGFFALEGEGYDLPVPAQKKRTPAYGGCGCRCDHEHPARVCAADYYHQHG